MNAALAVTAGLFALGCGGPPATSGGGVSERPFAGVKLTVACGDTAAVAAFRPRVAAWANRSGVTAEVVQKPPTDAADADVLLIPPAELGGYAARNELQPLPAQLQAGTNPLRWTGFARAYGVDLTTWGNDRPMALPLVGDGFVCVYRADRLSAAKLAPPSMWEQVAEVAAALDTPGKPPLPPLATGSAAAFPFYQMAACYDRTPESYVGGKGGTPEEATTRSLAFLVDPGDGKVRLSAPAFRKAFDWFRLTAKYRPTEPGDPLDAVASGSAVWAVVSLADLTRLPTDPATGAVDQRFGVAPLPGTASRFDATGAEVRVNVNSVPYLGAAGLLGAVRAKAANAAACWDLLADLGGPGGSAATLEDTALGAGPLRDAHAEDDPARGWRQYRFDAARTEQLGQALKAGLGSGVANPALALRTPDQAKAAAAVEKQLWRAARGEVTGSEAAAAAEAEWTAAVADVPPEKLMEWRRKAAGLD